MDRVFESGAAASPPTPPASPSNGYATAGNPSTATQATKPGPYWYHMTTESMRQLIVDAGLTPDHTNLTLVSKAVQTLIAMAMSGYKASARAATTASITTLAGGAPSTLDGVTLAANDRILVKDQATASQNGVYVVTTLGTGANGTWTRATDADGAGELSSGAIVAVQEGSINADSQWMLTTDGTITPGTTSLVFTRKDASSKPGIFNKADTQAVVFTKTGAGTLNIKAGTLIDVAGVTINLATATAVVMPTLTAGTDYAIYACADGTIRADANFTNPTGYTTANSRQIGGFHYGLVAPATTVAGGSFATTGNGMIWTQTDVDNIAGINVFSLWDIKFRPAGADPRGMVLVGGKTWVDIYLCSTDTAANGTSKYNTNIASGTVPPKIPAAFGGNGTATYPTMNWWVANELARASKKRLLWEQEFVDAAFGVTENQSIDATASTYPTTLRNAGYTSKYGIEQASGHHWIWGQDSNFYSGGTGGATNYDVNGNNGAGTGRGQVYTFGNPGIVRAIFGGARTNGAASGSRASNWVVYPWYSGWNIGLRAACDHLALV